MELLWLDEWGATRDEHPGLIDAIQRDNVLKLLKAKKEF
jgi:hypothetical protein